MQDAALRLEQAVADRDQEIGREEGPEARRQGQQQVGRRHHHDRGEEHVAVAVAVGERAEHGREQVQEKSRDTLDHAAVGRGEAEPAVLDRAGQVQRRDGVEAVPAHALEDLHRVGRPERAGKLAQHTGLVSHGSHPRIGESLRRTLRQTGDDGKPAAVLQ